MGGSTGDGPGSGIIKPDDASSVELPKQMEDNVVTSLSDNVTLVGYASEMPPEELGGWYEQKLTEQGYELKSSQATVKIWLKGDTGVGLAMMPASVATTQVDMPESAETLVVFMRDDLSSWERVLTGIRGRAQISENGTVTFTPQETYPSPIPAEQYRYQLQTMSDLSNRTQLPQVGYVEGTEPIENGAEITLDVQEARPGDLLIVKYGGDIYTFWVRNKDGTLPPSAMAGGLSGSSPHG